MRPNKNQLSGIRNKVERAVLGTVQPGRSRFLVWTAEPALGPGVCPVFNYDLAAVRHEVWRVRRRLRHPAETGLGDPTPRMREVVASWGWELQGPGVWKTPEGELNLGWDGWTTIWGAARMGWERQLWRQEKRVSAAEARPPPDKSQ